MIASQRTFKILVWLTMSASIAGFWLWRSLLGPPVVNEEWSYQVWRKNIPAASALAFDHQGGLYATLELNNGKGKLLHLPRGNKTVELLGDMSNPDGMAQWGDTLYITNEKPELPIVVFSGGTSSVIEGTSRAEGIVVVDGNQLIVIEDLKPGGRLLRINLSTYEFETLLEGLKEGEGVCQDPQGDIYFTEKPKGVLQKYSGGKRSIVYSGLHNPAFLNCLDDGSILITEDRTNFGRLLHYKNGALTEIATNLRAPQAAIQDPAGVIYLAEQNRNRILRFERNQ